MLEQYTVAQYLFIRGLALCYLVAFASLYPQVKGLWGRGGVLPVDEYLGCVNKILGKKSYWKVPTLFWLRDDDRALRGLVLLGIAFSLALLVGGPALPLLICLWICYASFLSVGQDFLSFQWDILLLEVTVYAVVLVLAVPPVATAVWLGWFLLFRFLVSSGAVKLLSGCPAWRSLTAMAYHYETQPLPTRGAWYMHQLPLSLAKAQTVGTFVVEIAVPLLFVFPEPIRVAAALVQIAFQLFIIATGNYAFFNLLTIALCLLLIPNSYYPISFQELELWAPFTPNDSVVAIVSLLVAGLFLLNLLQFIHLWFPVGTVGRRLLEWGRHWLVCCSYGLFARMTTERNEIVIEGSDDGEQWEAYRFRWKPQELTEAPKWVMPHQPRLDWQMWFAALGHHSQFSWFESLMRRLLEGSEDVLSLLAYNPFPERPPRYLRARFYRYKFSTWAERRHNGQWWVREERGLYYPPVALQG